MSGLRLEFTGYHYFEPVHQPGRFVHAECWPAYFKTEVARGNQPAIKSRREHISNQALAQSCLHCDFALYLDGDPAPVVTDRNASYLEDSQYDLAV